MLIVSTTGATNINDEHDGNDDGLFDVPAELGEQLLRFPGWRQATEDEAEKFATDDKPAPKRASRSRKTS